jgi:hypothetical protein
MFILDVKTGEKISASIERVALSDLKKVRRERNYEFNWNEYKNQEVYKLVINDNDVLGLMCVLDHPAPEDNYLEIVLLEVRKDQRGPSKRYDRIAGCLIAFAADLSFSFGHQGFVLLISKTDTVRTYQDKYGFFYIGNIGGRGIRMLSDEENSDALIQRYLEID